MMSHHVASLTDKRASCKGNRDRRFDPTRRHFSGIFSYLALIGRCNCSYSMGIAYVRLERIFGSLCLTSPSLAIVALLTAWLWLAAAHRVAWIECTPVGPHNIAFDWGLLPMNRTDDSEAAEVDIRLRVGLQKMSFLFNVKAMTESSYSGEGSDLPIEKGRSSIDWYVLRTLSHNCISWEETNWSLFQSRSRAFVDAAKAAIGDWSSSPNIHISAQRLLEQAQKGCSHRHRLHTIGNICYTGILSVVSCLLLTVIGLLYISAQKVHVTGVLITSAAASILSIIVCSLYTFYVRDSSTQGMCSTIGSLDTLENLSRRHYSLAQMAAWHPRHLGYCFALAWTACCFTFLITAIAYLRYIRARRKRMKTDDMSIDHDETDHDESFDEDDPLERLLPL